MTPQEAKDQVAVEMGYKSFEHLYREFRGLRAPYSEIITAMDEAAELYAKSKWDEACEAYNRALTEHYCIKKDYRIHDDRTAYFVTTAPKPEFKP